MKLSRAPFTLLSCDNLQGNGTIARKALLSFAEQRNAELRRPIEANISFPCSMVDRITPKTTEEDCARIAKNFGVLDQSPVVCESFRQWVLEDSFVGTPDVGISGRAVHNGCSAVRRDQDEAAQRRALHHRYPGDLLGYNYIYEAVSDPLLEQLLVEFMAEVRQTLKDLPGIDLSSYSATVVKRFSNSSIRDQVSRICSNGCAKIARFILPSLSDLLATGISPRVIPLVLAAWLHYLAVRDRDHPGTIEDPSLELLRPFLAQGGSDAVTQLLSGTSMQDLSKMLSHKSVKITEKYYAPWVPERQAALERRMTEALIQMGAAVSL